MMHSALQCNPKHLYNAMHALAIYPHRKHPVGFLLPADAGRGVESRAGSLQDDGRHNVLKRVTFLAEELEQIITDFIDPPLHLLLI